MDRVNGDFRFVKEYVVNEIPELATVESESDLIQEVVVEIQQVNSKDDMIDDCLYEAAERYNTIKQTIAEEKEKQKL